MSVRISAAALTAVALFQTGAFAATTASEVIEYDKGTSGGAGGYHASYLNTSTALGETSRNTGYGWSGSPPPLFLSNPYNNPWRTTDWVSIGKGGHITLKLQSAANELPGAPELNVLVFQQILAGTGQAWYARQASVSVSKDGNTWSALNGGSPIAFNTPATGYVFSGAIPQDSTGGYGAIDASTLSQYTESDYGLPMPGAIQFGANFEATRAAAYGNSGGGNWLDFSTTGLDQVNYIRFDVASDAPAYFALDAVYVNNAAVPEPVSMGLLTLAGLSLLVRRRRNS